MIGKIINRISQNKIYENITVLIILSFLTLLMITFFMPLDQLNPGHDALFHHRRIKILAEAIENGSFPEYIDISALNNYGYGFSWFYPDLTLIPFSFLSNYIAMHNVYKIMWFIMTLSCGIITYIAITKITKSRFAAIVTCLLYTFCEYRLQDIYYRGSVGESFTFTFLPLVIWGLYEIIKRDYKKWYLLSVGLSLCIHSHLISSFLIFLTIVIITSIYYKDFLLNKKRFKYLIISGIATFILCAYFLLPFIEQLTSNIFHFQNTDSNILIEQTRLNNKELIKNLFSTYFFYAKNIYQESFYPSIGILLTFSILSRILIKNKLNNKLLKNIDILVIIGVCFLLLSLELVPWKVNPIQLISGIQFPWRFFELSVFFFAIGGGYYISLLIKKRNYRCIFLLSLILLTSLSILKASSIYKFNTYYYKPQNSDISFDIKNAKEISWNLEYLPQKTSLNLIEKKGNSISHINNETDISNFERTKKGLNFDVNITQPDILELPLTYYKGYNASLNNQKIEIRESKNGLIEIPVTTSGKVDIAFTGTPIQKYSIYITLISSILICIYIIRTKRKLNA